MNDRLKQYKLIIVWFNFFLVISINRLNIKQNMLCFVKVIKSQILNTVMNKMKSEMFSGYPEYLYYY